MMVLKLMITFSPAIFAWTMAVSYAQTLPEENRRMIERSEERLAGLERHHDSNMTAIREILSLHQDQIQLRMSAIENYLFWLLVTTGGVGTVVGVDKASYWVRDRKRNRHG